MTSVLRDFTDGEELMTLLTLQHHGGFAFVDVGAAQEALQVASAAWPEAIREKIISYFEVDPSVAADAGDPA